MDQSELPRRRSLRLLQHNYRWTASYFVTIRSEHHEPVFDMPELRAIVQAKRKTPNKAKTAQPELALRYMARNAHEVLRTMI